MDLDPLIPIKNNYFIEHRLYGPSGLPWVAKSRRTDDLVWYVIFDSEGTEVCNTGSVGRQDESVLKSQVMLILTSVNKTSLVEVDDKFFDVKFI